MDEGREQWPSRLSYILASMGGAVGIGNLLRYPSIAARHSGLQWFVPYFFALFFIGIPVLILEIAIGQAYRGAAVKSMNALHRRLRGLGLSIAIVSLITVTYYVNIMAYVLSYTRHSFTSPLPWKENPKDFFTNNVTQSVSANKTGSWVTYPDASVVGETFGFSILTWVFVYLCVFRGVALTGKIVYLTMLLPLLLCFAILIRAVTLPRAGVGIVQYVGRWNNQKLGNGSIWSDAVIQIFFSFGVGFGYYIAYSSYNNPNANAVQDALIIALGNSFIEVVVGFAAFAVVGFRGIDLAKEKLSSFSLGFFTYPDALAQIPGANAWSFFFFITIYLLAIDSAFALLESFIAVVSDCALGKKLRKEFTVGIITFCSMLVSLMYSTNFGLDLLDYMDKWVTGITLIFLAFLQCVAVTSLYRFKDVIEQTGYVAVIVAQISYISSMLLGLLVAHFTFVGWGILSFVIALLGGVIAALLLSDIPSIQGRFGNNRWLNALWWLEFYSGNQLAQDLNAVIGRDEHNWKIPVVWAPLLRWVSAPVLVSILSLSYREFGSKREIYRDPLQIFCFTVAHIGVLISIVGFVYNELFAFLIPHDELERDLKQYASSPGETLSPDCNFNDEN